MLYNEDIVRSYIDTMLWAENEQLDNSDCIGDDLEHSIRVDVKRFVSMLNTAEEMEMLYSPEMFGHNFYLTRQGHGAGFWDGDYKNGDSLTEKAQQFEEHSLYEVEGVTYDDANNPR